MSKSGKNGREIVSGNNGKNRERSLANLKPFQPGQSGNPLGRPVRKPLITALEKYLSRPVPGDKQHRTFLEKLVEETVKRAIKKSDVLVREIFERVEGKVAPDETQANMGVQVILMDKIPRPDREQFYHDNGDEED
jgi:Family of unknown function (DUF5681)